MKLTFQIVVQVKLSEGSNQSEDEIAAELETILGAADPGDFQVEDATYEIVEWAVTSQ